MAASFVSIKVDGVTSTAPSPIELIAANQATLLAYLNGLGYGTFTVIINASQTIIALYQNEHKIEEIVTSNPSYTWTINPTNCHTINVDPDEYCDYLLSQPGAGSGLVDYITAIVVDGNRYETPDPNGIAATDTEAVQDFLNDNGLSYINYSNNGSYYVIAALTNHVIHYIEIRRYDTLNDTEITTVLHFVQSNCHVPVLGCTNMLADNYNPNAEIDDGSCNFNSVIRGCTDPNAVNYNPNATQNDGSCRYIPTLVEDKLKCCAGQMAYRLAAKNLSGSGSTCCEEMKLEAVTEAIEIFETYILPNTVVRYTPTESPYVENNPGTANQLTMPAYLLDCNGFVTYLVGMSFQFTLNGASVGFSIPAPTDANGVVTGIISNWPAESPWNLTDNNDGTLTFTPKEKSNTYVGGTQGSGAYYNGSTISLEVTVQYSGAMCDWITSTVMTTADGICVGISVDGAPAASINNVDVKDSAAMISAIQSVLGANVVVDYSYDLGTNTINSRIYAISGMVSFTLTTQFPLSGDGDITVTYNSDNCSGSDVHTYQTVGADGEYEVLTLAECVYQLAGPLPSGAVITKAVFDSTVYISPDPYNPETAGHESSFTNWLAGLNLGEPTVTDWANFQISMLSEQQPMGFVYELNNQEYFIAFERTSCNMVAIVQVPVVHQEGEGCDFDLDQYNRVLERALQFCEGCCHNDEDYVNDSIR